jgi:hypothetical protein
LFAALAEQPLNDDPNADDVEQADARGYREGARDALAFAAAELAGVTTGRRSVHEVRQHLWALLGDVHWCGSI